MHGLASEVALLGDTKKHNRRLETLRFLLGRLDERATFPWKGSINTRANLNSEVFESIASAVGIDCSKYRPRYNLIDLELLKRRNQIAHGDWLDIEDASFRTLADETILLMRWFKTDLENSVALIPTWQAETTRTDEFGRQENRTEAIPGLRHRRTLPGEQ